MGDAAMPGHDQHFVLGEKFAERIGIRKNGAEHERPGEDSAAIHGTPGKQLVAGEQALAKKGTGNPMGDGIHGGSLQDRGRGRNSAYENERRALGDNATNLPGGDALARERLKGVVGCFRCNGDQKSTGSLRIEE